MLWLRFVKHAQICTDQVWEGDTMPWTDNQSLINCADSTLKWTKTIGSRTTALDWDAVQTMAESIQELKQDDMQSQGNG